MKSIDQITNKIIAHTEEPKSTSVIVSLPCRPCPLETMDIEKLNVAISQFFDVKREPNYGYIAIKDDTGEITRQEFDVIGYAESYTPREEEIPQKLRESILRPAERRHIIFHLARLAAHRRDTRGAEVFQAAMEDIAFDLQGVSEWAVVQACREMRGKNETWYPATGEIIETIKRWQEKVESMFLIKCRQVANERRKMLSAPIQPISRHEIPRSKWKIEHYDEWVMEAAEMVETARGFENGQEKSLEWEKIRSERKAARDKWMNATAMPQN